MQNIKIKEEANKIHDHTLELLGNGFNFNHEKGLAEWLKNSIDAYIREGRSDKEQYIIYRFVDGDGVKPAIFESIDFVGMERSDIRKAFMWWGDPNASNRGTNAKVYGGHGNGGKFYMRQMFHESYFITFRNNKMNIFGFNESKKYGFADGFEEKEMSLDKALSVAGINEKIIPVEILIKLENGETGFTLVRGIKPKNIVASRIPVGNICEKFTYHPQARRPLKFCKVSVIHNDRLLVSELKADEIAPMEGFENEYVFEIPEYIELKSGSESGKKFRFLNEKYPQGKLMLKTSANPFPASGKKSELNCIDIIGDVGVIGSYRMNEIGFLKYYPQAQSIYGECYCSILEDPEEDLIMNDRDKLLTSDKSRALLEWISSKIDELGSEMAEKEQQERKKENIKVTDEFNQILNQWKDQFMSKIFIEILGGPGKGISTGGFGDEGSGGGKRKHSDVKGGSGSGSSKGGGEGDQKKKGNAMPRVLLSGQDDPDIPGFSVTFTDRHNLVEQRQQDVERGIYWINPDKSMANKIIEKYTVNSPRWRNYLFQRYIDIFIKEMIDQVAKKEGGTLTPTIIDMSIMELSTKVNDVAANDLEDFLLNEKYENDNLESNTPESV